MEWAIKRFFHCQMFVLWTVYIRCSLLMARTLLFHSFSCYLILAYFSSFFFGVRSSSLDAILLRITIGDFYLSNIYYCCFAQASNDANWQYARLAMATGAACDRSTINRLIFASNSFYFIIYDYEIVFRIFINCKRPNNDEWVIAITRSQPLRYCVYLSIRFVRWIKCFCSISVSYSIIYKLRDATQLQYVRVCRAVCQQILESFLPNILSNGTFIGIMCRMGSAHDPHRCPMLCQIAQLHTHTASTGRQDKKKTDSAIRMIYMRNEENKNDAWYDQNDHSKWAGCVGDKLCSSIWPYSVYNVHYERPHSVTSRRADSNVLQHARRSWIWICDDKSITHCERIRSWMRMPCIHK